jgi:hypothetical protein
MVVRHRLAAAVCSAAALLGHAAASYAAPGIAYELATDQWFEQRLCALKVVLQNATSDTAVNTRPCDQPDVSLNLIPLPLHKNAQTYLPGRSPALLHQADHVTISDIHATTNISKRKVQNHGTCKSATAPHNTAKPQHGKLAVTDT